MGTCRTLIGVAALTAGLASAQARKATIIGGGDANRGKCTAEVVVDGAAQIEVRGDTATLRNAGGQAPQWRRFECTGPMPANPGNFRFAGVDGRGRQTLLNDPRNNGGTALVRIEDSDSGSEGYTFDLFWGNEQPNSGGFRSDNRGSDNRGQDNRDFRPDNRQPDGRDGRDFRAENRPPGPGEYRRDRRMTEEEAFDVCRRSIRDQAADRFRTPNIDIRNVRIDDNPGRRDWITGDLAVRRRFGRQNIYGFTCSVNFDTGVVRTAHIDQFERAYYPERR